MRSDEEEGASEAGEYEQCGRQSFVGEVGGRHEESNDFVVNLGEIFHTVLEVAHISEEIFGELFGRLDHRGRGYRWTEGGVGDSVGGEVCVWRCWMAGYEGWDEESEDDAK